LPGQQHPAKVGIHSYRLIKFDHIQQEEKYVLLAIPSEITTFVRKTKSMLVNPTAAQLIHSLLVPGILIMASSILLFSTNSRYSAIVDRIRLLKAKGQDVPENTGESSKTRNKRDRIELQISHLIHRIYMIRITIVSYSAALLFFSVTTVLLGVRSTFEVNGYYWVSLSFLFAGLLAIINGVVFSVIEVFKTYRIVHIEISEITP
jgi:hypothetical protein